MTDKLKGWQASYHVCPTFNRAGEPITVNTDELDARMTVRLPDDLKDEIEIAASDLGDSVNTFVVRALSATARQGKRSSRTTFQGTIET